uniref:Uncharacterized protein n=1 Tax=Amphimedon queenslandica TaxID=400682 RepID=A0A1X7TIH0_AMPQE
MAELECKKALADYYYSIKEENNTINEDEMHTIAQAAYSKIMTLGEAVKQVHFYHVVCVVAITLLDALFNALIITSDRYNPYDDLNCFGYYNNRSEFEVES